MTAGLLPPDEPIPAVGQLGGPLYPLPDAERSAFLAGRAIFDRDVPLGDGLGPRFNGDSCRACHFEPILGGAGPLGVNAMRHGHFDENGDFEYPAGGTGLRVWPFAQRQIEGHELAPSTRDGVVVQREHGLAGSRCD